MTLQLEVASWLVVSALLVTFSVGGKPTPTVLPDCDYPEQSELEGNCTPVTWERYCGPGSILGGPDGFPGGWYDTRDGLCHVLCWDGYYTNQQGWYDAMDNSCPPDHVAGGSLSGVPTITPIPGPPTWTPTPTWCSASCWGI